MDLVNLVSRVNLDNQEHDVHKVHQGCQIHQAIPVHWVELCRLGQLSCMICASPYLIFVIFVTQARFLEPKFYTEKCVN